MTAELVLQIVLTVAAEIAATSMIACCPCCVPSQATANMLNANAPTIAPTVLAA